MEILLGVLLIGVTIFIIVWSTRYKIRFWFGTKEERGTRNIRKQEEKELEEMLKEVDKWDKDNPRN